ncbi:lysine-specific demethylase 7-like [Scleropages formosus]|uniref:Lysine-specific demethylase 7-like n=1 Tax=Scleropages formosus TaxID=113540 RepID=A0A0P7U7A3_SCLFO|nr:lysine-specific demethylase 7-like [Scleropages formosus]
MVVLNGFWGAGACVWSAVSAAKLRRGAKLPVVTDHDELPEKEKKRISCSPIVCCGTSLGKALPDKIGLARSRGPEIPGCDPRDVTGQGVKKHPRKKGGAGDRALLGLFGSDEEAGKASRLILFTGCPSEWIGGLVLGENSLGGPSERFRAMKTRGCVQVEEHHAVDIDVYHCPNCDVLHGPSLMKKRNNWHRHDYTEPDDGTKPVQAGTSVFVQQLQARTFPSADEILVRMHGSQVTQRYLEKQGFEYPIAVAKLEGLGLQLPPPTFSVKDVEQYVGGDKIIDVIDVARQADSKIRLGEFVKYFCKPHRPKVLNVISLEFSDTKMAELVKVPDIAQKMSWVENYWPDDSYFPKPFVQKYCLMGVKESYTDFHIDFGGTSVWYHVLWGEKIFYLIKPTQENLALYEEWSSSPNQSEVFFGKKVDKCYKCVVRQGMTLLIPTGWIHAVLTSQDCMAFGGNFLHNLNIGMQLRCYEMERRLKTPDLFKFPYFEAICWYVAKNLLETLKELREDNCQPPTYLVEGVKALISALRSWLKREIHEPTSEVPDHIRPNHLIKELTKEIRYQEEDQSGSKPMKSQGGGTCPVTRSTLERGCQARRTARRLRDNHAPKTPSNLDILELHTREVLRRLEVAPFEEEKWRIKEGNATSSGEGAHAQQKGAPHVKVENGRLGRPEQNSTEEREEKAACLNGESSDEYELSCRKNSILFSYVHKGSSSEDSGSSSEEEEEMRRKASPPLERQRKSGDMVGLHQPRSNPIQRDRPLKSCYSYLTATRMSCVRGNLLDNVKYQECGFLVLSVTPVTQSFKCAVPLISTTCSNRERPTSPSTEAAVQGMLSMAGLMHPPCSTDTTNSQEPWWSSPAHCSPVHACGESLSGEESQGDSDSNSSLSHQKERQAQKHRQKENKSFMDSQSSGGSQSSSSETWADPVSPLRSDMDYQYRETSLSPPLHPSKRPASNPPPISNQATKGKRPKKGMATAKQRLGKILKLNRHNRFFV